MDLNWLRRNRKPLQPPVVEQVENDGFVPVPVEKGTPEQTDNSVRPEDGEQPLDFDEALADNILDDDDDEIEWED